MSVLFQKDYTFTGTNQTIVTTTELAVQTSNPVPIAFTTAKVPVKGTISVTPGTGTTQLTLRLYRAATIVGQVAFAVLNYTVVAGNSYIIPFEQPDTVSGLGTVQYTASVQQTGATANGTVFVVTLEVEVLSG